MGVPFSPKKNSTNMAASPGTGAEVSHGSSTDWPIRACTVANGPEEYYTAV